MIFLLIKPRGDNPIKNIERLIERAKGHMAMSGMPLTEEDRERMRRCGLDQGKIQQTIDELVRKHTAEHGECSKET